MFILNSPYIAVNFLGVMVQLASRVTIRKTNLGIKFRTLTGRHFFFFMNTAANRDSTSDFNRRNNPISTVSTDSTDSTD